MYVRMYVCTYLGNISELRVHLDKPFKNNHKPLNITQTDITALILQATDKQLPIYTYICIPDPHEHSISSHNICTYTTASIATISETNLSLPHKVL